MQIDQFNKVQSSMDNILTFMSGAIDKAFDSNNLVR